MSVSKVVLATHNQHKVKELQSMLSGNSIQVYSLYDFPGAPEPEETGTTFVENATIKAKAAALYTGFPALADDSGICIDALGGAPGIFSARWAGLGSKDVDWIDKTLRLMANTPDELRACRYVCALCLTDANGDVLAVTEGEMEGRIGRSAAGDAGFGYDPIFLVAPTYSKTAAELSPSEKHTISHRGLAFKRLLKFIQGTTLKD